MQFMEAFNYAKKFKTSLRLPGQTYMFVPHKDNSISIKDYKGNTIKEIKDTRELIEAACEFTTDKWMICGCEEAYKYRKLMSFEDALKELKSGNCIARFNDAWEGIFLALCPDIPIINMDKMKDKYQEDILNLLVSTQLVATEIETGVEYTNHYKFSYDDIMAQDWFIL